MTSYAVLTSDAGPVIVAVWPASVGHRAISVCSPPKDLQDAVAMQLCDRLTSLSQALWESAVALPDDDGDVAAVELRERGDDRVEIVEALDDPNLPDGTVSLLVSYDPPIEAAHELGRLLHTIGDGQLSASIVAQVQVEIDAVERAGLGDLEGRAVQAVGWDRVDPSPVQVVAADALLREQPLGDERLWTALDPAASCVAAAHWLAAAAEVAGEAAGMPARQVFAFADDIEAVSVEVPSLVVAAVLDAGVLPRQVVVDLLLAARRVGEGRIPDPVGLIAQVDAARDQVARLPLAQREATLRAVLDRITVLDPRRPSRDLLEHLLDGIRTCRLVFSESGEDREDWDDDDDDGKPGIEDVGDAQFGALVREQAARDAGRLSGVPPR
jgi:hypothetical protein